MEVNLSPEIERKLNDIAAQSGRPAAELAQDAIAGYVGELADTRVMLDRRYDEINSGRVKPVEGELFFENLRQREDALLKSRTP